MTTLSGFQMILYNGQLDFLICWYFRSNNGTLGYGGSMGIDRDFSEYFSSFTKYLEMPKTVYHYCDLHTFLNIISSSSIRLSNIAKSNDLEEITYVIPYLINAVFQALTEYNLFSSDDYYISKESIENVVEMSFNELSKTFYVSCFSEVNDLVDQWARYADHAKGVAIGFSTECFIKLQTSPYTGYVFGKIIYEAKTINEKIIEMIQTSYEKNKSLDNSIYNHTLMLTIIRRVVDTMLYYSILYKNPSFKQEKEWRLIYNPFGRIKRVNDKFSYLDRISETNTYKSSMQGFYRSDISFKTIENNLSLTSYIDLNFSKLISSRMIREIIIGSQSKLNTYDNDLMMFLHKSGYKISNIGINDTVRISKSTIPYNK